MFFAISLDHVVAIDQLRIALHRNHERAFVAETEPGAAVGEGVGRHRRRGVQRLAHAAPNVAVPVSCAFLRVDAGAFPEPQLKGIGAAVVTARDKRRLRAGYRLESGDRVAAAFDARWIIIGSDDHKIIPCDLTAVDAVTLADEFLLSLRIVYQHKISVAAPRGLERLAG